MLSEKKEFKKILVIQTGGIGDSIMSIPSLRALRENFDEALITLVVLPRSKDIFDGCPYVNEVKIFDLDRFKSNKFILKVSDILQLIKWIRSARQEKYDISVNLFKIGSFIGAIRMSLLLILIGPEMSIGRRSNGLGFYFDIKTDECLHEVDTALRIVEELGCEIKSRKPELWLSKEDLDSADSIINTLGVEKDEKFITINPGSARQAARWLPERFAEVSDRIGYQYRAKIIIIGSKDEIPLAHEVAELMDTKPIIASGMTDLKQLAGILSRASFFITNDSGPMHIAAALGVPLIVIFGASDYRVAYPRGEEKRNIVLYPCISCYPCDKHVCDTIECQKEITVDRVLNAVDELVINNNIRF